MKRNIRNDGNLKEIIRIQIFLWAPLCCFFLITARLSVFLWRQMDASEFKKIKFIQIQIFSKVKRYRFVWKCYKDPL